MIQITEDEYEALRRVAEAAKAYTNNEEPYDFAVFIAAEAALQQAVADYRELERNKR